MSLEQMKTGQKYIAKYKALDQEYSSFKTLMQDVSDYILPRRGLFNDDSKPQGSDFAGRHDLIIDGFATRANRFLGAGMQGGLVSPSRPWFKLSMLNEKLAGYGPVKRWLESAEQVMYRVFAKSNFYNQIHTVFEEEGGFGTAVLFQEEDFDNIVNFYVFTAGTYRLATGKNGMVNTIARKTWYQAHQLVEKFGVDRVSQRVRELMDTNPYEWVQCLHFIEPREDRQRSKKDSVNMPWRSIYIDPNEEDLVLGESGFKNAPHAAPRWNTVGNWAYGLGPGADVRGQVKMLQEMQKSVIKALHKEIEPPMSVPSKYKGVLSLVPGAVNYVDMQDQNKVGPLYQLNMNIANVLSYVQDIKDGISKDYYNDLFLMIAAADKSMTATEVAERHEEKLLLLGPTIERQEKELLTPVLDRTFAICLERGLFPDIPPELEGSELKFDYVSLLAQAQQLVSARSINTHISLLERVGQASPEAVMATTDFVKLITKHADIVGVPASITRTPDEAEKYLAGIRQAQQQQAEQQQQIEMMKASGAAGSQQTGQINDLAQTLGV